MKKNLLVLGIAVLAAVGGLRAQPVDSLDLMIGQMIMIGLGDFDYLRKGEAVFQAVEEGKVGGIILFEKNISTEAPEEFLSQIITYAQKQAEIPLLVGIDEEGGRVNRLKGKYGFPTTVSAQYLGELNNLDSTRHYARNTASTLKDLGINVNFAPCVDLNINPVNPVIGRIGRSYGREPELVVRHAGEVIRVHDEFGVVTSLKHFPGHGSSKTDTHLGLTDVSDTWNISELYPYKQLIDSGLVRSVMSSHIVNDNLDSLILPGTLSYAIIQGVLRDLLGFEGVVFSDDMQMGAVQDNYGLEEAIRLAINAGVDILLFANNVPEFRLVTPAQLQESIRKMVDSGEISRERISESFERIMKLKASIGLIKSTK